MTYFYFVKLLCEDHTPSRHNPQHGVEIASPSLRLRSAQRETTSAMTGNKQPSAFARAVCLSERFLRFGDHFVVTGLLAKYGQIIDIGQFACAINDKDRAA